MQPWHRQPLINSSEEEVDGTQLAEETQFPQSRLIWLSLPSSHHPCGLRCIDSNLAISLSSLQDFQSSCQLGSPTCPGARRSHSQVPARGPSREVVVLPVLKEASLDPEMATNYRPVANIPFLGKVLEWVVVGQLQALLDETDYLDPFQSGFRPGYGTESALVALYDDLCREKDRGSASLLVLLDLSAAFNIIDHGILLDRLEAYRRHCSAVVPLLSQ
ncbi:RNA-directed DNA polymerase from mobile element jockey [Varanus komodoensis]|nr:RNA-directed DNA polymerase from mobile element jockey [Varanus komodoensis]